MALAGAGLLSGARARAHERGMSQLDLAVTGARVDAHAIFAVDDRIDTAHWFDKALAIEVDGRGCAVELGRTEVVGADVEAWATYRCDDEPGRVVATLYELGPGERVVASLHTPEQVSQAVLTDEKRQLFLVITRTSRPIRWPVPAAAAGIVAMLTIGARLLRRRRRSR